MTYEELNIYLDKLRKTSARVPTNAAISFPLNEALKRLKAEKGLNSTRIIEMGLVLILEKMGYKIDDRNAMVFHAQAQKVQNQYVGYEDEPVI